MPETKIITAQRVVTTAGTPEKIKEAPEYVNSQVIAVEFRAHTTNTGNIFITYEAPSGDPANASTVGRILAAGEVFPIDMHDFKDMYIDLSKIWFDAAVSGEGLSYAAVKVIA